MGGKNPVQEHFYCRFFLKLSKSFVVAQIKVKLLAQYNLQENCTISNKIATFVGTRFIDAQAWIFICKLAAV